MEVKYSQNPMHSLIILTDVEKEQFRNTILKDILEEELITIDIYIQGKIKLPDGYESIEDYAKKEVKRLSEMFEDDELDQEVEHQFEWMIEQLEQGYHVGDCTCVPASCGKCHAEYLLGFDTIKGLGKHEGAKLSGYFHSKPDATAKDCLEHLKNNPVVATEDWHHGHIERWNKERENVIEWLKEYIVDKLGEEL